MNKLEQNCNPNSASVFFGNTLRLLAIKDIGEEEVSYVFVILLLIVFDVIIDYIFNFL